jgi:predicted dehydrogenase
MKTLRIGMVGCGNISTAYFKNAARLPQIEIVAVADLNRERAEAVAEEQNIQAYEVDELLLAADVELILNLTIPSAHAEVALKALKAGKHTFSEKPFGVNLTEAGEILKMAEEKGLKVGCAPDTFLGGGQQTARKALDDGWIGQPLSGTVFLMSGGPEKWHPNPDFFYQAGGGPLFDMGPYYITSLVNLLGPVKNVTAKVSKGFETRTAGHEHHLGRQIPVDVPTFNAGILEFKSGVIVTAVISFDCQGHSHRPIEIYGTEGSLHVPDPNTFGGPVNLKRAGGDWKELPLTHSYNENYRSLGCADMASALLSGRPHRANGELAYHVLEVMCAFESSSKQQSPVEIRSLCPRPAALPTGLFEGLLD